MKKPDRDREAVANAEIHQSYTLLRLGAKALIELHERYPLHRSSVRTWVEHHERAHQEVWDELIGKVRASEILSDNPVRPDDETAERMLNTLRRSTADLEQVLAWMRDLLQTRPERRAWAANAVAELRMWALLSCTGFARQLVAVTYLERLERISKPQPIGVTPGESVRPIEPPPIHDAEYEAWAVANPDDRIDPLASAEDFIAKQPDKAVTRLGHILGLYRAGLMERPWGEPGAAWDAALLEDVLLVRSCAVRAVTPRHLNWWLKPLRPVVEHLDDSLASAGTAALLRLMASDRMLITKLQYHGWIPTHLGRDIVNDRILPQWRTATPDPIKETDS